MRRYYHKIDSMKSMGVCYWCVKIPQCWYMEHGLKDIAFYFQKHITPCTVVITSLLVRDKPLGSPASVKQVYCNDEGHLECLFLENINMLQYFVVTNFCFLHSGKCIMGVLFESLVFTLVMTCFSSQLVPLVVTTGTTTRHWGWWVLIKDAGSLNIVSVMGTLLQAFNSAHSLRHHRGRGSHIVYVCDYMYYHNYVI